MLPKLRYSAFTCFVRPLYIYFFLELYFNFFLIKEVKQVSKEVADYVEKSLEFFQTIIDQENDEVKIFLKTLLFEEYYNFKETSEKIIDIFDDTKEDRSKHQPQVYWNTLFIFLMKNVDGKFRRSRELMIEILFQFFNKSEEKNDHFVVVLKQMIQTKSPKT